MKIRPRVKQRWYRAIYRLTELILGVHEKRMQQMKKAFASFTREDQEMLVKKLREGM